MSFPDSETDMVLIRDSKQNHLPDQSVIGLSPPQFERFIAQVVGTDPVATAADGGIRITPRSDGWISLTSPDGGTELSYDSREWEAFTSGAKSGHFRVPAFS